MGGEGGMVNQYIVESRVEMAPNGRRPTAGRRLRRVSSSSSYAPSQGGSRKKPREPRAGLAWRLAGVDQIPARPDFSQSNRRSTCHFTDGQLSRGPPHAALRQLEQGLDQRFASRRRDSSGQLSQRLDVAASLNVNFAMIDQMRQQIGRLAQLRCLNDRTNRSPGSVLRKSIEIDRHTVACLVKLVTEWFREHVCVPRADHQNQRRQYQSWKWFHGGRPT